MKVKFTKNQALWSYDSLFERTVVESKLQPVRNTINLRWIQNSIFMRNIMSLVPKWLREAMSGILHYALCPAYWQHLPVTTLQSIYRFLRAWEANDSTLVLREVENIYNSKIKLYLPSHMQELIHSWRDARTQEAKNVTIDKLVNGKEKTNSKVPNVNETATLLKLQMLKRDVTQWIEDSKNPQELSYAVSKWATQLTKLINDMKIK